MTAQDFYKDLPSFSDFSALDSQDDFRAVPQDWVVLTADVVQSRQAISEGRYKEVNMVGAAVVAAVLNRLGRDRVPFVFGGDGAILIVPGADAADGGAALAGVVSLARETMNLELRAAAIPIAVIRAQKGDIRIRKYSLSPGNHLAMMIGDGLLIADRILKDPAAVAPYEINATGAALPSLDGLSCRWEPLSAQNGHILSLIIKPVGNTALKDITEGLADCLGYSPLQDGESVQMATRSRLRFTFPPSTLALEARFTSARHKIRSWLKAFMECVVFYYSYKTGNRFGPFDPKTYFPELASNTDHRKLGDSLQLVLDVSADQLTRIRAMLAQGVEQGRLVYGLHVSDTALMTCFVQDIGKSQHIHFVDGADGGLSVAATDFNRRLSEISGEKAN